MGRNVKRVHMDFDWYEKTKDEKDWKKKIWFGYIIDKIPCQLCDDKGTNLKGKNCQLCYGDDGINPRIEPPYGNGWQMWEDVSEGTPISPVFKTAKQLGWSLETSALVAL